MTNILTTDVFIPADVVPLRQRRRRAPRDLWHPSREADRLLVVVMDGEDRGARPNPELAYRVLALHTDEMYRTALPSAPDEPVEGLAAGERISGADRHTLSARLGLPVLHQQEFIHRVVFPEAYRNGAVLTAFDPPVLLGSLATRWHRARRTGGEVWSLLFCPLRREHGPHGHYSAHPHCPGVRIEPGPPPLAFIDFTAPHHFGDGGPRHHRGRWCSLRSVGYVLTGADHAFESLCRAWGIDPPAAPASGAAEDRLCALLVRLDAICRLAELVVAELRRHPVLTDENELFREKKRHKAPRESLFYPKTPAMLLRTYFRAAGIDAAPPLVVAADVGMSAEDVTAAARSAFRPARVESLDRCRPLYGVMLDVRSCFSVSAIKQGVSRWWGAARLVAENIPTKQAQADVEASRAEDYLDQSPWLSLTDLYLVHPNADLLPITIPIREPAGRVKYESVWGTLTIPKAQGPVWYPKALVLISRWRTGKAPTILRALRIRADGTRAGLRTVRFRDEVPLDPHDPIVGLIRARRYLEAQGLSHLVGAAKIMPSAACYGIAQQQVRRPGCDVRVLDGVRTYHARPGAYWAPGGHVCPPMSTFTVAGSWVVVELMEHLARQAGGAVPLVLTDCGLITSANGTPPEEIARVVIAHMERLNPLPDLLSPLVKPQDGTTEAPEATCCYTVAAPEYARYDKAQRSRGERGLVFRKVSGHGFSQVLDPETGCAHRNGETAPAWWGRAFQWIIDRSRPGRSAAPPPWFERPVIRALSYRSPGQAEELGRLRYSDGSSIRPFATVYQRTERVWREVRAGLKRELRTVLTVGELPPESAPSERVRPVTYGDAIFLHSTRRELKAGDGDKIGPLRRYVIHATAVRHAGREAPDTHGQEAVGGPGVNEDEPLIYALLPTRREIREACRILKPFPRQEVANRLGISRRRLLNLLTGQAVPRARTARRLVALAAAAQQNGAGLPVMETPTAQRNGRVDEDVEPFAALRARGYSVARTARIAGVTERAAWDWQAGRFRPRARCQERLRAALEDAQRPSAVSNGTPKGA